MGICASNQTPQLVYSEKEWRDMGMHKNCNQALYGPKCDSSYFFLMFNIKNECNKEGEVDKKHQFIEQNYNGHFKITEALCLKTYKIQITRRGEKLYYSDNHCRESDRKYYEAKIIACDKCMKFWKEEMKIKFKKETIQEKNSEKKKNHELLTQQQSLKEEIENFKSEIATLNKENQDLSAKVTLLTNQNSNFKSVEENLLKIKQRINTYFVSLNDNDKIKNERKPKQVDESIYADKNEDDSDVDQEVDFEALKLDESLLVEKTEANNFFICKICLNIVKDPMSCGSCTCLFCIKCFEKNLSNFSQAGCPNCRNSPFQEIKISLFTKNHLNNLDIFCPFNCRTKIKYEKIKEHSTKCENFNNIPCKHCLKRFKRPDIKVHETICDEKLLSCDKCQLKFPIKHKVSHDFYYCSKMSELKKNVFDIVMEAGKVKQ